VATAFVVLLGAGAAVLVAALGDDATSIVNADAGTCINDPGGEVVNDIDPVPCDEPHQFEMIGSVKVAGDSFPGEDPLFDMAVERCIPLFEDYVGIGYDDSVWWLNAFTPTQEGWERGDRVASCLVFQFDEGSEITMVTGSAKGDGR